MALLIRILLVGSIYLTSTVTLADEDSIGPDGIRSSLLNLTGEGISIGQIEVSRPGVFGVDDPFTHEDIVPTGVFRRDQPGHPDDHGLHPLQVAGIMISKNTGIPGVSPDAQLYSSAYVTEGPGGEDVLKSIQHVASRNGGDVRALNHSYGKPLDGLESPDGSSYLTMGLDWSSAAHNLLHVVAGEDFDAFPLPADNYNGVTVAGSRQDLNGIFSEVDPDFNNYIDAINAGRVWIDLIAPGRDIDVAAFNSGTTSDAFGTSLAAPHVTGTVALLQEYADDQIMNVGGMRWGNTFGPSPANYTAQRHEVMKAVLLNSADKLQNVHGSNRTIEGTTGHTWTDSPASTNEDIPLDLQFGAGHLNAQRALKQFETGEWEPFQDVPSIGWDFGETGGPGTIFRYPLNETLSEGEYIALTLAWDRFIDKTGDEDSFTPGDLFFATGLNDLDLFLVPEGSIDYYDLDNLQSISAQENVEHIFAKVPSDGKYDIVVYHAPGGIETDQHFGLAWWYGNPFPSAQAGDFDNDGDVDGRDFLAWQRGNSPIPLSASDLADWQANYGTSSLAAATVPEPNGMMLLTGLAFLKCHGRRSFVVGSRIG